MLRSMRRFISTVNRSRCVCGNFLYPCLVAAFCILASAGVQAQVSIGVRQGLSLSTITNSPVDLGTKSMAVGPTAGLVIQAPITDIFSFNTEVLLHTKGVAAVLKLGDLKKRTSLRIYYLDIPVLLRAGYTWKSIYWFGGSGPQFNVALWAAQADRTRTDNLRLRTTERARLSDKARRYEMSWDFEVGLQWESTGGTALEFSLRPVVGLTNITKEKYREVDDRNFSLLITTAITFRKAEKESVAFSTFGGTP